jgi:hypothetical protein
MMEDDHEGRMNEDVPYYVSESSAAKLKRANRLHLMRSDENSRGFRMRAIS